MSERKVFKIILEAYERWKNAMINGNPYPAVAYEFGDQEFFPDSNSSSVSNPISELLKNIPEGFDFSNGRLYIVGKLNEDLMEEVIKNNIKNILYYFKDVCSEIEEKYKDINFERMDESLGLMTSEREWWTHDFYNNVYDKIKVKHPVLIPSYNRPKNATIRCLFSDMTPECNYPVYLVVRESQREEYQKNIEGLFGIEILSFPDKDIDNLGSVRQKIVEWLNENGHEFGFMFDDDITELTYTFKGYTEKGDLKAKYLHRKAVDIPKVIAMWQLCMEHAIKTLDVAASSISPMFSSWKFDYTNYEQSMILYRGVPSQVMCINAKKFMEEGITYPRTEECAHEDIDMAIRLIERKLKVVMFPFLVYSANPMTPEFGNFGDTMEKRMKAQQEIMYRNHGDKEYVRFQDKRGLAQVSINWIRVRKILGIDQFRFNLWNDGKILEEDN